MTASVVPDKSNATVEVEFRGDLYDGQPRVLIRVHQAVPELVDFTSFVTLEVPLPGPTYRLGSRLVLFMDRDLTPLKEQIARIEEARFNRQYPAPPAPPAIHVDRDPLPSVPGAPLVPEGGDAAAIPF